MCTLIIVRFLCTIAISIDKLKRVPLSFVLYFTRVAVIVNLVLKGVQKI